MPDTVVVVEKFLRFFSGTCRMKLMLLLKYCKSFSWLDKRSRDERDVILVRILSASRRIISRHLFCPTSFPTPAWFTINFVLFPVLLLQILLLPMELELNSSPVFIENFKAIGPAPEVSCLLLSYYCVGLRQVRRQDQIWVALQHYCECH
jgi:hypothetical protein